MENGCFFSKIFLHYFRDEGRGGEKKEEEEGSGKVSLPTSLNVPTLLLL